MKIAHMKSASITKIYASVRVGQAEAFPLQKSTLFPHPDPTDLVGEWVGAQLSHAMHRFSTIIAGNGRNSLSDILHPGFGRAFTLWDVDFNIISLHSRSLVACHYSR